MSDLYQYLDFQSRPHEIDPLQIMGYETESGGSCIMLTVGGHKLENIAGYDRVKKEVEALKAKSRAPQWQPIETAPRNRHILLGVQDGPFFVTLGDGKYQGMDIQKYKIFCIGGKMELPKLQPTHWTEPLPRPPENSP